MEKNICKGSTVKGSSCKNMAKFNQKCQFHCISQPRSQTLLDDMRAAISTFSGFFKLKKDQ